MFTNSFIFNIFNFFFYFKKSLSNFSPKIISNDIYEGEVTFFDICV